MNWDEQREEFDKMCGELNALRNTKGKEYSTESDSLSNFKKDMAVGVTSYQSLGILLNKHMRSIESFIRTRYVLSDEPILGRINDAINYLFLLRCLIMDEEV